MSIKILCPVCKVNFTQKDDTTLSVGDPIICSVCGAKLKITDKTQDNIAVEKYFDDPEEEIRHRVDTFARLRNYTFSEDKEDLVQGLLDKKELFGEFFCPCRLENIEENICPCVETRKGQVQKDGHCL